MGTHPIFESDFDCLTDGNMSMFAGQNGGPYSGSVTNPMMNPMMNNYSQNISAWMAPKQYGILATGVGSARDNILPGNVTKINRDEHKQLLRAKRYAMEVSLKFAMRKQAEKKQKMQAQQVQRQRAVSIMCKIYVGSIYYEIGEQTIKQSFETFGPVRSIDMSYDQSTGTQRHKGFCFLEFETPEAAFMALDNMQSITIGGRAVKVGRLSNIGQAQHFIQQFAAEASKYNRVYISNIHSNIQDDDIRAVFESFGDVISCQLVRNPDTGFHKHYGFVEYKEPKSMKEAIQAMNGFDLGGQLIRVGPCVVPPSMHQVNTVAVVNPSTALHGAKKIADMLKNMKKEKKKSSRSRSRSRNRSRSRSRDRSDRKKKDEPKLGVLDDGTGNMIQLSGGAQRNILMQKLMRSQKTKVICLRNMIGADEIDDALEGEVTEECSNYGQVHKVVIYQEKQSDDPMAETIVKIFVQFAESESVDKAREALGGRFFSGRKINATPYDQNMFDLKDYTA